MAGILRPSFIFIKNTNMPFIKSSQNGSKELHIFYEDMGSGEPVILIHGWPLNHEMWEYQTDFLVNNGFRVIAYDRRGFGKSGHTGESYDYNTLAADLNDLITELNLSDVAIVGFSMGGGEVVRYLSKYGSSKVSKIALVGSIIPYMLKTDDNPDGVPQEMFDEMKTKLKDDRPAFLETFGKQFYGVTLINHPVSSAYLQWSHMHTLMASPKATEQCMISFSSTDFRDELTSISVPTLIIHGDADKTVPIEATAYEAAKAIPNAKLIVYEGAPHGLFATEKEKLNEDLLNFLSRN
jgi:non-heme chloroperoxidase